MVLLCDECGVDIKPKMKNCKRCKKPFLQCPKCGLNSEIEDGCMLRC